jgi:hypothetical protein
LKRVLSWIVIVLLVVSLAACFPSKFGSSGTPMKHLQMGDIKLTVPLEVPDFSHFAVVQATPLYEGECLKIIGVEAINPEDSREFILVIIVFERVGKEGIPHVLGFQHSIVSREKDPVSIEYIDQAYLETGTPTGVFVKTNKTIDGEAFISMREKQLKEKKMRLECNFNL